MEDSIFTKILNGKMSGVKVWEDDQCFVLMDKFPTANGQTLVIPKQQIDYILDVPDDLYSHLWLVAKRIGKASHQAFDARRICFIVEGFDVPHVHIRIYPIGQGEALNQHHGDMADDTLLAENAVRIQNQLD